MMTLLFFGANAIRNHGTLSLIEDDPPHLSRHRLPYPPITVGGNGLPRARLLA